MKTDTFFAMTSKYQMPKILAPILDHFSHDWQNKI